MKNKVVLIRHGETKWNREGIFRGHSDVPLNENGLAQAAATAEYLKELELDELHCSPLSRARQTAEAICRNRSIKPRLADAFIDISFGPWKGKSYHELSDLYPEQIRIWKEQPHLHSLPGAETLDEARLRAFTAMQSLVTANPGKNIAILSHRVILKLLLLAAINAGNESFWKIKQDTCCINRLDYNRESGFTIITVNETYHHTYS